jgi:hypothetical protein
VIASRDTQRNAASCVRAIAMDKAAPARVGDGRRGDYRVIYRIDRPEGLVLIVYVDHRADVYR